MRLDTVENKMELGYQVPEPGKYLFQVSEGIELFTNENSGKTSLKVPTKIVEAINGDEGSVDLTVIHFCPIETNYGEKQVCSLLTITGLTPAFEKRFADGTSFKDNKFVDSIKLKLPGKLFVGEIEVRENNKGQKNANFKSWERHEQKKSQSKFVEGKTNEAEEEEW
jgi:hypothetical protein